MDNVIQFPKRPAIFGAQLRKRLVEDLQTKHQQPEEIVDVIEDTICREIVANGRSLADRVGRYLGEKLAHIVFGTTPDERKSS